MHRRALDPLDVEVGLEGVDLASERVAPHDDVEPPEGLLVARAADDRVGEKDHPGAGPVDGQPVGDRLLQRFVEIEDAQELVDRGRLPARQDETVHSLELRDPADTDGARA